MGNNVTNEGLKILTIKGPNGPKLPKLKQIHINNLTPQNEEIFNSLSFKKI